MVAVRRDGISDVKPRKSAVSGWRSFADICALIDKEKADAVAARQQENRDKADALLQQSDQPVGSRSGTASGSR